jgi:hypothetical protein
VIDLDIGLYRNMRNVRRAGLHEIHKELEDVASTLKDFRATGGGVLTLSPTDVDKRYEDLLREEPAASEREKPANAEVDRSAGGPATKVAGYSSSAAGWICRSARRLAR